MGYSQVKDLVLYEFDDGTVIEFNLPSSCEYGATETFRGIKSNHCEYRNQKGTRPIRIVLVRPSDLDEAMMRAKQCIHPHYQDNIIVIGSRKD